MTTKIEDLIFAEKKRQEQTLMMIPSENYASPAVLKATGSVLANKYAEGYPGKRYYQGNSVADQIETYAQELGKKLFNLEHINVQPYSGSPANTAVLFALLNPGDTICGMKLSAGGHLTHGHPNVTISGKYFHSVQYLVDNTGQIDYKSLEEIVVKENPKIIFAGATAYPYKIDWKEFSRIAKLVDAWLVADISHIAGLIVGGVHQSPTDYVHIITSTTHKTLRGPRGAFIGITKYGQEKDNELSKKIDRAVFPGLQGGPHINTIAAMAVAFEEVSEPFFATYAKNIVANASALSEELKRSGLKVFGTENHLLLIDVGLERGKEVAVKLEEVGIVVNANTIPFDQGSPFRPSGIRLGTPALTTRGMGKKEMIVIAHCIAKVIKNEDLAKIKKQIATICSNFPVPK